jgi:hypothetical protein
VVRLGLTQTQPRRKIDLWSENSLKNEHLECGYKCGWLDIKNLIPGGSMDLGWSVDTNVGGSISKTWYQVTQKLDTWWPMNLGEGSNTILYYKLWMNLIHTLQNRFVMWRLPPLINFYQVITQLVWNSLIHISLKKYNIHNFFQWKFFLIFFTSLENARFSLSWN